MSYCKIAIFMAKNPQVHVFANTESERHTERALRRVNILTKTSEPHGKEPAFGSLVFPQGETEVIFPFSF